MSDTKQRALDLIAWLTLPGASQRYPEANVMAGWLTILVNSCTPEECSEQLESEVEAVKTILKGAA